MGSDNFEFLEVDVESIVSKIKQCVNCNVPVFSKMYVGLVVCASSSDLEVSKNALNLLKDLRIKDKTSKEILYTAMPLVTDLMGSDVKEEVKEATGILLSGLIHDITNVTCRIRICLDNAIKKEMDIHKVAKLIEFKNKAEKNAAEKENYKIPEDFKNKNEKESSLLPPSKCDLALSKALSNISNLPNNEQALKSMKKLMTKQTQPLECAITRMEALNQSIFKSTMPGNLSKNELNLLAKALGKFVLSTDKKVAISACTTITFLSCKWKTFFQIHCDYMMNPIFRRMVSPSGVSNYAYSALSYVIQECCCPSFITLIHCAMKWCSQPDTKRKCSKLMQQIIEKWEDQEIKKQLTSVKKALWYGLNDKSSEVKSEWQRCFYVFERKFSNQAALIFVNDKNEKDLNDSSSKDIIALNEIAHMFTDTTNLAKGRSSLLLKGKIGSAAAAIRRIDPKNKIRRDKELFGHSITKDNKHFVSMICTLEITTGYAIVTEFCECNLRQYMLENKDVLKYNISTSVVHQVAEGLLYLHRMDIVYGELIPEHIFIVQRAFGITAKLGNFKRIVENTTKLHDQTKYNTLNSWSDPQVLGDAEKWSKASDAYSLGLIGFFVWSGGKSPEIVKQTPLTALRKYMPNDKSFNFLGLSVCYSKPRSDVTGLCYHPVFWKPNTYSFFLDRFQYLLGRLNNVGELLRKPIRWKKDIPSKLLEELVQFRIYNYTDDLGGFMRCMRNICAHIKTIVEAKSITNIEIWIEKSFPGFIVAVYSFSRWYFDEQFLMELSGHMISK